MSQSASSSSTNSDTVMVSSQPPTPESKKNNNTNNTKITSVASMTSTDDGVMVSSQPPTPESKKNNNTNNTKITSVASMTSTDDGVMVEVSKSELANMNNQEHHQPTIINKISLCAVRLSESMAKSVVSGIATTGLISSAFAPSSLVATTTLVAEAQTQAALNMASSLLVKLPSDARTLSLMKRLVTSYSVANPACLEAFATMSSSQAAATTALGGALPLLVAAALQESIEVSRLVSGKSNRRQFFVSTAHVGAQIGGGFAGLAVGAAAGTFLLPGIGTGVGGAVGSMVGASTVPWVVQKTILDKFMTNNNGTNQTSEESSAKKTNTTEKEASSSSVFKDQHIPESHQFHFYWTEEETEEGFVLINYDAVSDENPEDKNQEEAPTKKEDAQRTFMDAARALLSRATVVPVADLQNNNNNSSSSPSTSLSSQAIFETVDSNSTVFLLRSDATSLASMLQSRGSPNSSTTDDNHQEGQEQTYYHQSTGPSAAALPRNEDGQRNSLSRIFLPQSEATKRESENIAEAQIGGGQWSVRNLAYHA